MSMTKEKPGDKLAKIQSETALRTLFSSAVRTKEAGMADRPLDELVAAFQKLPPEEAMRVLVETSASMIPPPQYSFCSIH